MTWFLDCRTVVYDMAKAMVTRMIEGTFPGPSVGVELIYFIG